MKRVLPLLLFVICLGLAGVISAQDTLPRFSVRNAGNNRIIIGWVNPFPTISQISIQRSFDSLTNYKTILTVTDPKAVQNGFADTKAPNDRMFYRLFYVIQGGSFYFTKATRPDTSRSNLTARPIVGETPSNAADPVTKKPDWVPSYYVYTNKDGYVFINLPNAGEEKYSIKFFEDDDTPLFELKPIRETGLTLDKANFVHAGWFRFELYNGEKLVERNKFYLSKAF